jgi:putative endonuclease
MKKYYVYIITNKINTVFYTGVTNDLNRRIYEHQEKLISGFTSKYNINKLIYFQEFSTPVEAIEAEKKIKGWTRDKKINLIKSINPAFIDLNIN